jgi:hypothetical protein
MHSRFSSSLLALFLATGALTIAPLPFAGVQLAEAAAATPQQAVNLVHKYYYRINHKRYAAAFSLWEKLPNGNAANGQSFAQFKHGFLTTRSVSVVTGPAGPIDGAAGSLYIEIPAKVRAVSTIGKVSRFKGHYTLRSSNVSADHRWRIFSAALTKVM